MGKRRPFGSIVQRAGRPGYYVRFHAEGQRVLRAAGPTRAGARKLLAGAEALLATGHTLQDVLASVFGEAVGNRLTLRDAAPLYLAHAAGRKKASTLAVDAQRLRVMCEAPWAGVPLASLRPDTLMAWFVGREATGVTGATLNRYRALGGALYRWAERAGHVEQGSNPFRMTEPYSERGRERVTFLLPEESAALLDACAPLLRPLVLAALHTGARRGELLAMEWRDVDLERGELFFRPETEKAGRGRAVTLTAGLAAELSSLRSIRPRPALDGTDRVFVDRDGHPMAVEYVRKAFARAVASTAAIPLDKRPAVTFHVLRHTAASILANGGVSEFIIGRILGQSSASVRARYQHLFPTVAQDAVDVLGRALGGGAVGGSQAASG